MTDIERTVMRFYRDSESYSHHRYKSWEHCYRYFLQRERIRADGDRGIDHAALHLGFFLASWGMYRGSAFLLQRDYKIHTHAVRVLLREEYDTLLRINFDSRRQTEGTLPALFALGGTLRSAYADCACVKPSKVTDTLVTKVLLGTCGCTPAYDRYFVRGLQENDLSSSRFNSDSFAAVCRFYRDHAAEFKRVGNRIADEATRYPAMKLVDMYFWQVGYSAETGT